ncbi:MAG TPA: enoyl-CoA hydratase/isomerase family protein [Candidatus Binataceae bacterium]|jgi:enoyl-CoA hydratase/carnithine racemase|nr:enoyl-CoA hydratase/isomerase family protein [Candidatus Binataceae bacterium]
MAEEVLKIERQPNYLTLTLNRPEKRNSLNAALLEAMDKALAASENDKEIRALIVRGAGKSFCAGLDLAEADRLEGGHSPVGIERVFHRLEQFPVPTIAAVQGAALAGGCELALHCDLRVAAQDARIGMTVARVGLLVPYDFIRKLIEVIGSANTAQILYTGEPVTAERALQMGMVHEVVAVDKLDAAAVAWAEKVAANAPLSLRTMKKSLRRSMSAAFDAWHDDILEMGRMVRASKDAKEGIRAFLEKRKPVWRAE